MKWFLGFQFIISLALAGSEGPLWVNALGFFLFCLFAYQVKRFDLL